MLLKQNLAWSLAALLLPSLGAGQQPSAAVSESVDVNIVNVDVWVSDRKGSPMTGLVAKDFQLFEDEKKVKVVNFYEGNDPDELASLVVYVDNTSVAAGNRNTRNFSSFICSFIRFRFSACSHLYCSSF